jgi:transposase InsO family protein
MPKIRTRRTQEQLIAMKQAILDRYRAHTLTRKDAALLLGMHPNAVSRLAMRYRRYQHAALVPKKPGPKKFTPKNRTPEDVAAVVTAVAIKHPELGPQPLANELRDHWGVTLEQTTVWRILKREQVRYTTTYHRWKDNPTLYCLDVPGEELQMDACYPYGRARKLASFDAIDDCSRHVFGEAYEREDTASAIRFITTVIERAPFRVQRVRVDNRYGKRFREYCETVLGIEVIENDPYTPKQNGKIERFHKTLKREFYWRQCSYTDSLEVINYKYRLWLHHYNYERRHSGYGMHSLTPVQKITTVLLQSTANTLITYPQKVTGTLQQYKTCTSPGKMVYYECSCG